MLNGPYFGVAASVAGLGALVIMLADYGTDYFPSGPEMPIAECRDHPGQPLRSIRTLEGDEVAWATRELTRAQEPSLYLAASEGGPIRRTVRFTFLRSFDPTVVVRVNYRRDGSAELTAYQAEHRDGQASNRSPRRMTRPLSADESAELDRLFDGRLWRSRAEVCGLQPDGALWILEEANEGGHAVINQPSPGAEAREAGLYLLSLTGWDYGYLSTGRIRSALADLRSGEEEGMQPSSAFER